MAAHELSPGDWRAYGRKDFPQGSWSTDGGLLRARANTEPVDLVTRERFGDFALTFEWWLPHGGNSGVLLRVDEELPEAWMSGPELQLVDDEGHPDGTDPRTSCGSLYGLLAPTTRTSARPPAFRSGRAFVQGTNMEFWLDGRRVLSCDLADERFSATIAVSKFRDSPRFAKLPEGHIALQHHGTEAAFRYLRLETL